MDEYIAKREYGSGGLDQLPSGKWRGRVRTPDGRRVTITRDSERECRDELRRLAGKVASGQPVASTRHTVKSWTREWLELSRADLAPRTYDFYEGYLRLYINPEIGNIKLTALKPDDVALVMRKVQSKGLSPSTALKCRTIMRRSLKVAMKYGHVAANVADLVDPPKQTDPERPVMTADQARSVLEAAAEDRLFARYATALYLGLRQGELLGLRWDDLDLDARTMAVRQQIQRLSWRHGCQDQRPAQGKEAACGHKRGAECPRRHSGGVVARTPKSRAGRRTVPVPGPLVDALLAHREAQEVERTTAGTKWQENGLVFTRENGAPLDSSADLKAWRALLKKAGVPGMGTHSARRTCATLLLAEGVDVKIVAEILGHSSTLLTQNVYQQADGAILAPAAGAITRALA